MQHSQQNRSETKIARPIAEANQDNAAKTVRPILLDNQVLLPLIACLIGVVTVFLILYLARFFFSPVISAFVMGIVVSPLSRLLRKLRLNRALAALATMLLVLAGLAALIFALEPYITFAIQRGPAIWAEFRDALNGFTQMLKGLGDISKDIAASVTGAGAGEVEAEPEVEVPSFTDALFYAPQVLAQIMVFSGTLYFFLLARGDVYAWIGASMPVLTRDDLDRAERKVARYFLTITAINGAFGTIVGMVMMVLGMPSPVFWGLMAFLLNFIVYLGPILLAAALLVAGLVVFDGPFTVVPALVYMAMNATEGQFVTPALVGQRMSVSPLLVFLSLTFWLWFWGPIGGIIAIPLMIWTITITEAALGQSISAGFPGREAQSLKKARAG